MSTTSTTTTTTTTNYVVKRRWEVFQFHPAGSPPPLPLPLPLPLPINYEADGSSSLGAREMDGGQEDQQHWRSFDSSVNAVSFGFVATAILISLFLVMAIFERFLRPNPTDEPPHDDHSGEQRRRGNGRGVENELLRHSNNKLGYPVSPKMSVYTKGVSVLMPGEQIPTFIAHPTPVSCPPHRLDDLTVQQHAVLERQLPPHLYNHIYSHNNHDDLSSHGSS